MTDFKIDKGVPIPDDIDMGTLPPLRTLSVGESIAFPLTIRKSVQTVASKHKRLYGTEFTVKKVNEQTARVWRVK